MGMPACRITDLTAHGGTIILGFPTVMIGMMPASRITDMHVCPMLTVLVPHVGGPFILGSPTVLVGMMPQSRVTDTLVCVGPPDIAVKGEMTVLVGMAGAGGAAGASAGADAAGVPVASVSPDAVAAAGDAPKAQLQADGTVKTFAPPGQSLPPMTLTQEGWPDLPPEVTATFSSVQPATIAPGTTLYAPGDADAGGGNAYWTASPPDPSPPAPSSASDPYGSDPAPPGPDPGNTSSDPSDPAPTTPVPDQGNTSADPNSPGATSSPDPGNTSQSADWNSASHVQVSKVPLGDGVKAWAGQPADGSGPLQIWAPPDAMADADSQRFRMPGAAA